MGGECEMNGAEGGQGKQGFDHEIWKKETTGKS